MSGRSKLRSDVFIATEVGFYHCYNRVVRQRSLFGFDVFRGKDFGYRKDWVRTRLCELAGSMAIRQASTGGINPTLIQIALSSMVILFSMWWMYFSKEEHIRERRLSTVFIWAYGHLFIFSAGAAVGAGFAVLVDTVTNHGNAGLLMAHFSVSIPVGGFMLGLWFVRDRHIFRGLPLLLMPTLAILIALAAFTRTIECIALLTALSVLLRSQLATMKNQGCVFEPGHQ